VWISFIIHHKEIINSHFFVVVEVFVIFFGVFLAIQFLNLSEKNVFCFVFFCFVLFCYLLK